MGRFSQIEVPWIRDLSIGIWKRFADDLALHEAKRTSFKSLHDCFTRELREGARTVDPDTRIVTSPCDAIIGAAGRVDNDTVIQAKGFPYPLRDLLCDEQLVDQHRNATFVTLRLKSSMYHRFHAPTDCRVRHVTYISGDTWNVDPIALRRIERLYCKNERAVLRLETHRHGPITLVPVAAILVAGIKLHCLDPLLDLRYRGPNEFDCDAQYEKGAEMGYFQHGSTIIVFASSELELAPGVEHGKRIRMGEPLLHDPN